MTSIDLAEHRQQLLHRFRFFEADTIIAQPRPEEMDAALVDALSYINGFPPETKFTLDFVAQEGNPYRPIWYQAAGMFMLATLVRDWTANGYEAEFQELSIPDRKGEYESTYDATKDLVDQWLERYKLTDQKTVRRTATISPPRPIGEPVFLKGRGTRRYGGRRFGL